MQPRRSSKVINLGSGSALRRSRNETQINLRKAKKDDYLSKRRRNNSNVILNGGGDDDNNNGNTQQQQQQQQQNLPPPPPPVAGDIPKLGEILRSHHTLSDEDVRSSVCKIRKLVSVETDPPIPLIVSTGLCDPDGVFTQLLRHRCWKVVFETLWVLTNISSHDGEATDKVAKSGAVPILIQLEEHYHPSVREQTIWCLGNIAGDNTHFRDSLISANIIPGIQKNVLNPESPGILKNCAWLCSNLCRGTRPKIKTEVVHQLLPIVAELIKSTDLDVIADSCWALSYMSTGSDSRILACQSVPGLMPFLIDILATTESTTVLQPATRVIGNFTSSNNPDTTQMCIDSGIINVLPRLLSHRKKQIKREACWTLSNIAAGTPEQVQSVIQGGKGIIQTMVEYAKNAVWEVRKEAVYVICNICTNSVPSFIHFCVEFDSILALTTNLKSSDKPLTLTILSALSNILSIGKDKNYAIMVDEADGVEALEKLQEHEDEEVYMKALRILEKYFNVEEECDDDCENIQPVTATNSDGHSTFSFGAPTSQDGVKQSFGQGGGFNFAETGNLPQSNRR